jgi:hypothetical protein
MSRIYKGHKKLNSRTNNPVNKWTNEFTVLGKRNVNG